MAGRMESLTTHVHVVVARVEEEVLAPPWWPSDAAARERGGRCPRHLHGHVMPLPALLLPVPWWWPRGLLLPAGAVAVLSAGAAAGFVLKISAWGLEGGAGESRKSNGTLAAGRASSSSSAGRRRGLMHEAALAACRPVRELCWPHAGLAAGLCWPRTGALRAAPPVGHAPGRVRLRGHARKSKLRAAGAQRSAGHDGGLLATCLLAVEARCCPHGHGSPSRAW
ncbi:hypothetical protein Dimus_032381 [Dionaea muscipula]